MEILERLTRHARVTPARPAIVSVGPDGRPDRALAYADLHAAVGRVSAILRSDSDRPLVAILSDRNGPEYAAAFLGILAAGGSVFPVPAGLSGAELKRAAQESRATVAIACGPTKDRLGACGLRTFNPDEIVNAPTTGTPPGRPKSTGGLLLQSSGTTSLPKLVFRNKASLDAVAANVAGVVRLTDSDIVLAAVPMTHSYGIESALLGPLWAGACIHAMASVEPAGLEWQLSHGGVTVFPGVPFMFEILGAASAARAVEGDKGAAPTRSALRCIYSAGSPLPLALEDRFAKAWGRRVGQLYGATELGSATFNDPTSPAFDPSSVGVPMPGVAIRLTDPADPRSIQQVPTGAEGQILVRAPSMFDRYVGAEAPIVEGFFQTGDLGRTDAAGRLWITGRLKFLIDVGGIKVNPLEVETVMSQHPDIRECVVVPVKVSETVSRLRAVVTARAGSVNVENVRAYAREHLAVYKVPRIIDVRESLPRSASGKVLRRQIEEEVTA